MAGKSVSSFVFNGSAGLSRVTNRLLIADAANITDAGDASATFLTDSGDGPQWMATNAAHCVMPNSSTKLMSVVGISKSSLGSSAAAGVSGAIIADNASKSGWAFYGDVQFEDGNYGYGFEIAVKHKKSGADTTFITPNTTDTGATIGIQLGGGGDSAYGGSAVGPSTVGLIFTGQASGSFGGWQRGIVFKDSSIYGATATTGSGVAVELARTHLIQWENSAGTVANIGAAGNTADLDIVFTPGGSGKMQFGSHSAIAAETITGYITIKDSGGTDRKIAVVS